MLPPTGSIKGELSSVRTTVSVSDWPRSIGLMTMSLERTPLGMASQFGMASQLPKALVVHPVTGGAAELVIHIEGRHGIAGPGHGEDARTARPGAATGTVARTVTTGMVRLVGYGNGGTCAKLPWPKVRTKPTRTPCTTPIQCIAFILQTLFRNDARLNGLLAITIPPPCAKSNENPRKTNARCP